jgi:type IV fimbrial biogenesis protein FimT
MRTSPVQVVERRAALQPQGAANRVRRRQHGVTLIELIIGLVVVSLLLMLGIPSFKSWMINSQIRNASEAILNGIQLARANAIQQNRLIVFDLSNGATPVNWRVYLDGNSVAGPDIQRWTADEGAKNTVMTPAAGSGTIVTFNGLGQRVANSLGGAMLTQINVTSSASSSAEIRSLSITIGASGGIKMCDPDPVLVANGDPRAC